MEGLYSSWEHSRKDDEGAASEGMNNHQAVLIYVTLGMMPLTLDLILLCAFKSAFKILAWQILCMELPYPER